MDKPYIAMGVVCNEFMNQFVMQRYQDMGCITEHVLILNFRDNFPFIAGCKKNLTFIVNCE